MILRINIARITGIILLALGFTSIAASIQIDYSILALVGLGLVFWGAILVYIQAEDYVKEELFSKVTLSVLETLEKTLAELNYEGKAVYLPPMYLSKPTDNKAYIPKHAETSLPTIEQIQKLERPHSNKTSQGMLINPPGAELAKLFEKTLNTSLTGTDLKQLEQKLPKLLVEELETASHVEINSSIGSHETDSSSEHCKTMADTVTVKITAHAYREIWQELPRLPHISNSLGCPLTSAIACALTRTTGRPITVADSQPSTDYETITVEYTIHEPTQAG